MKQSKFALLMFLSAACGSATSGAAEEPTNKDPMSCECSAATSSDGSMSSTGTDGLNGVDGAKGATGAVGPQGPQGEPGAVGPQGEAGPQGPTGASGTQGPQGPQGVPGPAGAQGTQGPMGPQGPAGLLDASHIYVVEDFVPPASTSVSLTAAATCEAGDILLSGGCIYGDSTGALRLTGNIPVLATDSDPPYWSCVLTNPGVTAFVNLRARAICLSQ